MQTNYNPGFTGFLQADVDLLGFLNVGLEGAMVMETPKQMTTSLNVFGVGIGASAYFYPISRLYLGAGGSFGVYSARYKLEQEEVFSNFYWRGYGEIGFRINPTFTVNAFGGFGSYMVSKPGSSLSGPFAGVSAKITLSLGASGSTAFRTSLQQDMPVYPLYLGIYKENPIAYVSVHNQEGAEITDVKISFRAGKYTSETIECASYSKIGKYKSVQVPLLASFNSEILKFSENGKISGELVIDYKFLGEKKQSIQNLVVDVYHRNAFSWEDSAALASFISPNIPEIYEFSKYVAGIARNGYRSGLNRNLEMAIAMVESLRLAGVEYSQDTATPYTSYHLSEEVDSVQFPLQTMNFLGGDYDDIGLLLASCLESVGVPTGYLVCDDDFIVLVDLNVKPSSAGNHFGDVSKLIVDDYTAYFGMSMKHLQNGFSKSLSEAEKIIQLANEGEIYCEYVNTSEAWGAYKEAVFTGSSGLFKNPGQTQIEAAYKKSLDGYVNTEINQVIANARKTGDPNKVGLALVRIGRYAEAKAEFQKSSSIQAMNNLANVYIIEKNYDAAIRQFNKVLEIEPGNATATNGIKKAESLKGL